MNDKMQAFLAQAEQDPTLKAQLQALTALSEADRLAALTALAEHAGYIPAELNEDELAAVAGGVVVMMEQNEAPAPDATEAPTGLPNPVLKHMA